MTTYFVKSAFPSIRRQRGVTLIVALVILLVMSVVAVASMSGSTLQARMASNEKQIQISLHAAEAGSRAAVLYLNQNAHSPYTKFKSATDGLYSNTKNNEEGLLEPVSIDANFSDYNDPGAWTDDNSVEVAAVADNLPSTAKDPRYIIEFLGTQVLGNQPVSLNGNQAKPTPVFHYRIVAIGWAQDPQIYSIVQTTYKTAESF